MGTGVTLLRNWHEACWEKPTGALLGDAFLGSNPFSGRDSCLANPFRTGGVRGNPAARALDRGTGRRTLHTGGASLTTPGLSHVSHRSHQRRVRIDVRRGRQA